MGILKKIFHRKICSEIEIKEVLENVAKEMYKYCISDAKQIISDLKSYDVSNGIDSDFNYEELMTYVILSNSLGLDTNDIRIQKKYFLFIRIKTMWLFKQKSNLDKSVYVSIPDERFQDGDFIFVHRIDDYLRVLKNSTVEMGTANICKLALKNIYGDEKYIELERAKILAKLISNLRFRYKDVPFLDCLF